MFATKTHLPAASITWLQNLIQANIDSHDGLKEAAANLPPGASSLATLFTRIAAERGAQASELQDLVVSNEEIPQSSGTMGAVAHRVWMDLRSVLGGGTQALLEEAERGEDYIKGRYEEALKELRGCESAEIVRKQYAAVKEAHDTIRELRDNCPSCSL
jgi:uncharacterized protein (TIGR02284 family)